MFQLSGFYCSSSGFRVLSRIWVHCPATKQRGFRVYLGLTRFGVEGRV